MSDQQMNLAEVLLDPRMGLRGKLKALSEVIASVSKVPRLLKRKNS
jgi:hypothetical protein